MGNLAIDTVAIGVASSLIASFLTLLFSYLYNIKWYKDKYGKLAGIYDGHGYKEDTSEWKLNESPQSEAKITHKRKNILEIEVTSINKNGRYKWKGTVHGSISWRYIKWGGKKYGHMNHKFGFKRVILEKDEQKTYFYLSPEPGDGFEKTIFMKKQLTRAFIRLPLPS